MADQPNDDVFNNSGQPPLNPDTNNAKYADLLKSIKNEDGIQKYDSIDKALEALRHSQQYIPDLKTQLSERDRELEELRGKVSKIAELEGVVERLARSKPEGEGNNPAASGLDEKAVLDLVQRTLTQSDQQKLIDANKQKVSQALRTKFGDKAQEAVAIKAAELGMTPDELGALAAKSPALVLKHFDAEVKTHTNPAGNSHNIPPINKPSTEMPIPSKPLLSQGTSKEREEHMKLIKEKIWAKHGITN